MSEASVASIKSQIETNLQKYMAELEQAGSHWERKPAAAAEGEDSWCARQVAEHIAGAGLFFGNGIAQQVGVTPPAMQAFQFPTGAEAPAATKSAYDSFFSVVTQIPESALAQEVDHPRLGKQTVGSILGIVAFHLNDHAGQLKALRES